MSKLALTGISMAAVITAFLIWWYGDARIIQRKSDSLVKFLNVTGSETSNFLILKTNGFANLLSESVSCRVNLSEHRSQYSYDELISGHNYFIKNVTRSSVKTAAASVTMIDVSQARFDAELSLEITRKGGDRISETGTISLHWIKNASDKWLVSEIDISRAEP